MEAVIEIQNTRGSFFGTLDKTSDVNIKSSIVTEMQLWIQTLQQSEEDIANKRKSFDKYTVRLTNSGRNNYVTVTDDNSYARLSLKEFMNL